MAQATDSSALLGTPSPEDWPGSQQGDTALNVTVATPSVVCTTASLTQVLYLQETGDPALISVNDIHQGQIGDCFLLSSIGELALWHPSAITNMIRVNADGTETVTLYVAASGALPWFGTTSFKAVSVTVNNIFPSNVVNNGASQDVLNGQKEIWVQVLEKAVATLNGGYNAIANGGYPVISMEELTGQAATWISPSSLTVQLLQSYMAAGDLIVMDTPSSGSLSYGLYNCHAYMFQSLTMVGGTPMVQLVNPWGCYQPAAIPLSQLPRVIAEVDIGQFAAGNNTIGTAGNDTITLPNTITNVLIDLGAGSDVLTLANGTNVATVANTETLFGGTGADAITLGTAAVNASIDLRAGNDVLTFGNFANSATVANIETVTGGTGNDTVTLGTALATAVSIDLGTGANKLTLANTANTGTVKNVTTLIGGAVADAITLGTVLVNGSVDLGAGNDTLMLANGTNSASVSNTETVTGGSGNDSITLAAAVSNASIDLGVGNDAVTLGAFANTATIANTETITGGIGADVVTLGTALAAGMQIDLGGGANRLSLANTANTGTVKNAATLIGGAGADTITLGTAAANASIDLGAGNDILTFGNFANVATVANTETVTGGSANDTITIGTALVNASVDLGAGNDTLQLGNFTNRVSVANAETVLGGTGNDTVVLTGSNASLVIGGAGMNFITGNTGADRFVFNQNGPGNITAVTNFNTAKGDKIALDTSGSAILSGNTFNLGGAAISLGIDLANVANASARLHTTLSNGGKGAFVYQQDTGELFYSGNGSFAGGGTQIGIITTNGSTPWAFNANSFIQV